ncbi:S8 family serine peptidase [Longimicrobium sp.]|uniref:S8 family serine peptidase n=1 Tax=Longimicrobium sp. TaxID=2029185 RepID=UPI002E317ABD|nr:S8 family serine peptidase [Longimicrobium sp.]HEX6041538.1 S8 family serine peptidase [Longimicrobium sp.]
MKRSFAALALTSLVLGACTDLDSPTTVLEQEKETPKGGSTSSYVAPYLPGRVIVRFKSGADNVRNPLAQREGQVRRMVEGMGARPSAAMLLPRAWVLSVTPGTESDVAARLAQDESVEFAEPDFMIALIPCETGNCADPQDQFLVRKWDLHNTGSINLSGVVTLSGAADADMDWVEAYDALGPAPTGTARIAIVDTGIRDTHQELAGRVVAARNFATGYPATLTEDRDSHGTHVAGIAAARGVAASGVAYGPGIQIINAKACERYLFPDNSVRTSCPTSSTADAIVWATDQGANVINLSLGGVPTATSGSSLQQAALQYARSKNVLPFCATGNDNYFQIAFPARFPECFAVAATTWTDGRASYSNYGPGVDIAAPGGDSGTGFPLNLILSLSNSADNTYAYKAGTSMATPQVVGLAALLFSQGVGDDEAVLARILETADDLGDPGADNIFGAGRINVCRALNPAQLSVSMPGAFNRKSNGVFPVVVYNVPGFDPSKLDEANITLGDGTGAGANLALKGGDYRAALVDVDGDGDLDLELKFPRPALASAVASGASQLYVNGNVGCRRVRGGQAVRVNG